MPPSEILHRLTKTMNTARSELLGSVSLQRSRYQHPGGFPIELWYECSFRNCEVYMIFEYQYLYQGEIIRAMKYAIEQDVNGVRIMRSKHPQDPLETYISVCNAKPCQYRFNSDYRSVDYLDPTPIENGIITENIHRVAFEKADYIHKFMCWKSDQGSFEREVRNYIKLKGCDGVAALRAVVKREGVIQGLLIPYIDGDNLWDAVIESEAEPLDITYRIIQIAAGLEKVGYYNEDLKCQNIVRRRSDNALFFIDFAGGLTDGFFRKASLHNLMTEKMDAKDGLFTLGKMLWQLWTKDHPAAENELPKNIPEPARSIIYDCCVESMFSNIDELQSDYVSRR